MNPTETKTRPALRINFAMLLFVATVTLVYGLSVSIVEFHEIPIPDFRTAVTVVVQWAVITVAAYPLFLLICQNRWVCAVILPLLGLLSGIFVFLRLVFHISPTPELVEIILANDPSLGWDFVTFSSVAAAGAGIAIGIVAAVWRWKRIAISRSECGVYTVIGVLGIFVVFSVSSRLKDSVSVRMPYSFFTSVRGFIKNSHPQTERRQFTEPVGCETDSITVVFVLGESLRADHLQLNGYGRATMPLLAKDSAVVSLPHIYSPEIVTHRSVPVILTRAVDIGDRRAWDEPSFISLFKKAGFRTSWLSNQDAVTALNKQEEHHSAGGQSWKGVPSYRDFMLEADTLIYANGGKTDYVYSKWTDRSLLPLVDDEMRLPVSRKLLVLHTIGSHWFYNSHFLEPVFMPVLASKTTDSHNLEQLVNSYDNTIIETDIFLSQLCQRLAGQNAIVFFISDHGESLGEDLRFLHGADAPELHNPACLIWYSPEYYCRNSEKIEWLRGNAAKKMTNEIVFHSVLDAAGISTPLLESTKSIFRP